MFYGWWVALTAALGLFLNTATIIVFSFGFFAKAMGQEFHSGRARISLAFTIHNLTSALCVPLAGRLVDRYGPRRVLLPFTALLGLILVSSGILSAAIWQLYAFYFALGVVSGGAGAMPYTDVVSHWFDRHRGLALSVMMLGMGLGAIVIPSVSQRLIATLGWRLAYTVFGFSILLIPLPVVAAFLKERPENMGLLPDGVCSRPTSQRRSQRTDVGLTRARRRPHVGILDHRVRPFSGDCERACVFHSLACDLDGPRQLGSAGGVRQFALRRWAVHRTGRLWLLAGPVFRTSCRGIAFRRSCDRDCVPGVGPRDLVCVHRRRSGRSRYRGRGRHNCVFDEPLLWAAFLWNDFRMDMGRLWRVWRIGSLSHGLRLR